MSDEVLLSKDDRIPRCDAGLAQTFHAHEEVIIRIVKSLSGMEYGPHFFQQNQSLLAGNPIPTVRTVVHDLL